MADDERQSYIDDQGVAHYWGGREPFSSKNKQSIVRLVVEEGVTVVESRAFKECFNLRSVQFPKSLQKIARSAFRDCESLEEIDFANSGILVDIKNSVFWGCRSLIEIHLPDNVKIIGDCCFKGCVGLTSVQLPKYNFDLGEEVFRGCDDLVEIEIPEGPQRLSNWVFSSSALQQIIIPNSVETIWPCAFLRCYSLKQVIFAAPGSSKLTTISIGAFFQCYALEWIKVPFSVDFIQDTAFYSCRNLLSFQFPDKDSIEISPPAFRDCKSLFRIEKALPPQEYSVQEESQATSGTSDNCSDTMSEEKWSCIIQGINNTMGDGRCSRLLRMDMEGFRVPSQRVPVVLWPEWFELIGNAIEEERLNMKLKGCLIFRQLQQDYGDYVRHCESSTGRSRRDTMSLSDPGNLLTTPE